MEQPPSSDNFLLASQQHFRLGATAGRRTVAGVNYKARYGQVNATTPPDPQRIGPRRSRFFWRRFPHFGVGWGWGVCETDTATTLTVIQGRCRRLLLLVPPPLLICLSGTRRGEHLEQRKEKSPSFFLPSSTFLFIFSPSTALDIHLRAGIQPSSPSPPSAVIPVSTCHQVHTGRRASGNQPAIGLDDPSTKS